MRLSAFFFTLLLTLMTAGASLPPPLVLFEGKKCIADWRVSTPVNGVTLAPDSPDLRFTIEQWKEGNDGWPRVNIEGQPIDLSLYSQIEVELENPTDQQQDVCLSIHSSREQRSSATGTIAPRSRQTFIVDISDGANPDVSAINHFSFFLIFPKKEQSFVIHKVQAVLNPNYVSTSEAIRSRLDLVKKQVAQAAEVTGDADRIAQTKRQAARAEKEINNPQPGYLTYVSRLLEDTERELSQAGLLELQTPFLVWRSPLGQPMRNNSLPPFGTPPLEKVSWKIAQNDYKAICVNVSAGSEAQSVSAQIRSARDDAKALFSLKPTYLAIARDGTETADAIGHETSSLSFEVPPFETRQFIIWVNTRKGEPKPGTYEATVDLTIGKEKRALPISLEVVNLRLPDQTPLALYNWAYFFVAQVNLTRGLEKEAVANLRDYGNNTWVIRYQQVPLPELDAEGRYQGLKNLDAFRQVMDLLKGNAEENVVLWLGFQQPEVRASFEKEGVVEGYLRDLRALLDEYGVAANRRYIKFVDEPKLDDTLKSLEWMARFRKADPAIRFLDNGSSVLRDDALRKRFLELVTIYTPDWDFGFMAQFRDQKDDYIAKLQREGIENLGFYRCRMSRKNHGVNINEYYRLGFWRLAHYGMKNMGFWTYNADHGEDEWDGRKGPASGGTVVYHRDGKLYTSRRWELFREGLSDYRLLLALTGGKENLSFRNHPELAARVKELLAQENDPAAAELLHQQLLKETAQ